MPWAALDGFPGPAFTRHPGSDQHRCRFNDALGGGMACTEALGMAQSQGKLRLGLVLVLEMEQRDALVILLDEFVIGKVEGQLHGVRMEWVFSRGSRSPLDAGPRIIWPPRAVPAIVRNARATVGGIPTNGGQRFDALGRDLHIRHGLSEPLGHAFHNDGCWHIRPHGHREDVPHQIHQAGRGIAILDPQGASSTNPYEAEAHEFERHGLVSHIHGLINRGARYDCSLGVIRIRGGGVQRVPFRLGVRKDTREGGDFGIVALNGSPAIGGIFTRV